MEANLHILVIEDQPVIALGLEAILLDLGHFPVGPASTNAEAKALLQDIQIDCAILDVTLRDGDTVALGRELIARGIPILFTSGHALETHNELPANVEYLQKPYSPCDVERYLLDLSN